VSMSGVQNDGKKNHGGHAVSYGRKIPAVLAEESSDFSPISQHIPQLPQKPGNYLGKARLGPLCAEICVL